MTEGTPYEETRRLQKICQCELRNHGKHNMFQLGTSACYKALVNMFVNTRSHNTHHRMVQESKRNKSQPKPKKTQKKQRKKQEITPNIANFLEQKVKAMTQRDTLKRKLNAFDQEKLVDPHIAHTPACVALFQHIKSPKYLNTS